MKRLIYIISALLLTACTENLFNEDDYDVLCSQISPMASIGTIGLPPAATKALIDASTAVSMEANALRIDSDNGNSWASAYITEATVSSSSNSSFRSMYLNPVQAYNEDKQTHMVSWYPRTCNLHKNEEGNAVTIKLVDFQNNRQEKVYGENDGNFYLNFSGLDGSKDIMVSDVVTGSKSQPFGSGKPIVYGHYMSAVKVYAYVQDSEQDVSMWGALRKVIVKNQPSDVSVSVPQPGQSGASTASFSGNVDFPLIKTPMYGDADTNPETAPDNPCLNPANDSNNPIYLGYALIKPRVDAGQKLELDIHTDAGMRSVSVPMENYFQAGYIYTVNICFDTQDAIAAVVLRSGNEHYYDLSSATELDGGIHTHQYANCYIIHPEIKRTDAEGNSVAYDGYAFDATTVGNGPDGLYPGFDRTTVEIDPVRAGLLWESSKGLVTQVELIYGYVRFKADSSKKGNAVIAVYDSQRKVLWSWHIWITDKPQDVEYTNGVVLLDRNLGATAETENNLLETYGLYYQWGRKDPSMGPKAADYLPQSTETAPYYDYYGDMWNYAGVVTLAQPTLRDGVENPMYLVMPSDFSMTTYQYDWLYTNIDNLWGDYTATNDNKSIRQKTIYDPCPFGYMVPQDEISTLFAGTVTNGTYGATVQDSFFPYAGYKGVDKGVSSLTGAWKYVGKKGDYMSSKIDNNGHRSRTYISSVASWTEYGADNDNDGDGDASRTYSSRVYADDMANRRTAASVRCVKRDHALNSSIIASFIGDKTYAFVEDGAMIRFDYDIEAYGVCQDGSEAIINTAQVDSTYNEQSPVRIYEINPGGTKHTTGYFERCIPKSHGLYRYRLISTSSSQVSSRVSFALRVFDISNIKIGEDSNALQEYSSDLECDYTKQYYVSFDLEGVETDFTVWVNNTEAKKVSSSNGTMSYKLETPVTVAGHLNIQIRDANGNHACHKTYPVTMSKVTYSYTIDTGNQIDDVTELKAGETYIIAFTNSSNSKYYCLGASDGNLSWVEFNVNNNNNPAASLVFRFHRDDTKAGGVDPSYNISAGAWYNIGVSGYLKEDFTFGAEADAVYTTCANNGNSKRINLYLRQTGELLYGNDIDKKFGWSYYYGKYYYSRYSTWSIYPVTVEAVSGQ